MKESLMDEHVMYAIHPYVQRAEREEAKGRGAGEYTRLVRVTSILEEIWMDDIVSNPFMDVAKGALEALVGGATKILNHALVQRP